MSGINDKYKFFKQIIRECNFENTYKMAWTKALVELSTEIELNEKIIKIELIDIAKKL